MGLGSETNGKLSILGFMSLLNVHFIHYLYLLCYLNTI